jgi:hypothetical protein
VSAAPGLPVARRRRAERSPGHASLGALLAAEWRKLQRTWTLPLVVLGPLGVTGMGVLFYFLRADVIARDLAKGMPPFMLLMNAMSMVQVFSLMLGTALLASQLADVEHRSRTWKQLFAMPVSRPGTFVAKFVWLAGLLAVASVLMVAGYAAIWTWRGYGPLPLPDFARAAALPYLAVLPLAALQLVVSTRIANQAGPLTIGILGTMFAVGGLPMPGWVPWTMPRHALFVVFGKPLQYGALWQAIAVEVVLLVAAGAIMLTRRDVD